MFSRNKIAGQFFSLCRRFLTYIVWLTLLGVAVSALGVQFALSSKEVIDVATGQAIGNIWKSILILAILVILQLILQILTSKIYVSAAGKIEIYLRNELFSDLLMKKVSEFEKQPTGELINRLNGDVRVVVSAVVDIIPSAIALFVRLGLSVISLFVLDRELAILCIVVAPLVFLFAGLFRKKLKTLHKAYQQCEGKIRSFMIEAFNGIYVIKTFVKEVFFTEKLNKLQNEGFALRKKKNDFSIMTSTAFFVAVTFGYYAALGWGAVKISKGLMTFGTLTAVLELIGQIESPIRNISSLVPQWFAASASLERIDELREMESDKPAAEQSELSDWKSIDFSCVSFKYEEISILDNFSLSVPRGSIVTIIGESGIGKSTLFKLLLGFIKADSGEIELVKKDGTKCALDSGTRRMFAYVPQVNLLMSGTIAQNIAFGNPVNYEKLLSCAKQAELEEVIRMLPRGFDTCLGENGLGLSEGEGQRVAIARALYCGADVLLMDEGTSALDSKTEKKIMENIKASGHTCIMISHRDGAFGISDTTVDLGRKNK